MKHLKKFNEDDYWPKKPVVKNRQEIEDEIAKVVQEWANEQVGEEISYGNCVKGGDEVFAGVSKKKVEEIDKARGHVPRKISDEDTKRSDEASKEEWRESADDLIDVLKREGHGDYELISCSAWGITLGKC